MWMGSGGWVIPLEFTCLILVMIDYARGVSLKVIYIYITVLTSNNTHLVYDEVKPTSLHYISCTNNYRA